MPSADHAKVTIPATSYIGRVEGAVTSDNLLVVVSKTDNKMLSLEVVQLTSNILHAYRIRIICSRPFFTSSPKAEYWIHS